jgi:hypothetical protein
VNQNNLRRRGHNCGLPSSRIGENQQPTPLDRSD